MWGVTADSYAGGVSDLDPAAAPDDSPTELGFGRGDRIWLVATAAVLGGGLFAAAPWLADRINIPFLGIQVALDWIAGFDESWMQVARPLLGLLVGAALALLLISRAASLDVYPDRLVIRRGPDSRVVPREDVVGIYRERGRIVIDGHEGRRIFDDDVEASAEEARRAFAEHGYPYES